MSGNFYSSTDARLYTGSKAMATKIVLAAASYGLTEDLAQEFKDAALAFEVEYLKAIDPITRTRPQIQAKDASRVVLKNLCVKVGGIIFNTPATTNEQLADLDLNLRKPRVKHGRPSVRPNLQIDSVVNRLINVSVEDPTAGSKASRPKTAAQALIYFFAGENYPSDPTTWSFAGVATDRKFNFTVPATVAAGTRIWVCGAYTNKSGDAGQPSVPISTSVQGDGSGTATTELKIAA